MNTLQLTTNPKVGVVFNNYPDMVCNKLTNLRDLILETAKETEEITNIEETLKWGEPSYLTKYGSTIRIDWKEKNPTQYAMYFKCTSRLVETFKAAFGARFKYEGKRAIVFDLDEEVPTDELKYCIKAALTYHKVKQLPTLGI